MSLWRDLKVRLGLEDDWDDEYDEADPEGVRRTGNSAEVDARTRISEVNEQLGIQLPEAEQQQWKNAVKPILDDYVKKAKEKNLPGDAMLADIRAEIAKATTAK